jgi:hypothetical protein
MGVQTSLIATDWDQRRASPQVYGGTMPGASPGGPDDPFRLEPMTAIKAVTGRRLLKSGRSR